MREPKEPKEPSLAELQVAHCEICGSRIKRNMYEQVEWEEDEESGYQGWVVKLYHEGCYKVAEKLGRLG